MTKKELESLGIFHLGSKVWPKRYFVPCMGEIDLPEGATVEYLLQEIFNAGRKEGVREGEVSKMREIKRVLEING